jgi:hypothetical protein
MKDPVALAYSGRIPEARDAAMAQAASDDDFLVAQGLEALSVLGQQHGVRTNARIDALIVQRSQESPRLSRKAFEAAMSTGSRALDAEVVRRIEAGRVSWEVLRYIGEGPSHQLGRALVAGWERIPEDLLDQALLTICSMPVANPDEAREFGRLALQGARHGREEIRAAAFVALKWWIPVETADVCARALTDHAPAIRQGAAELLAELEPQRLIDLAEELGETAPEAQAFTGRAKQELLRRALRDAAR